MTSWQRVKAYARQRGQDPRGQVVLTARQARRYVKKWHREFPHLNAQDYMDGGGR